MATYRVTCREKHSLYERIISIGCAEVGTGATQRFTEDEAINVIEKQIHNFYVERPEGHRAKVVVAVHDGRKYIKTEADGEKPDNLLSLPHCAEKPKVNTVVPPTRVIPARSHSVKL